MSNDNNNNNYRNNNSIQIRPSTLKQKIDNGEDIFILDVRTQEEHKSQMCYNRYKESLLVPIDTLNPSYALV